MTPTLEETEIKEKIQGLINKWKGKDPIPGSTEALRRIAREENVHYLETDPRAIPEKAWHAEYDECHLTAEGHRIKAEALASYIIQQGFIPQEMSRREADQNKTLTQVHEEAQQSRANQTLEAITTN